jgi:predicted Zn-dependent protease
MPVLVLLNLGISALPVYHYAVVIGYEPDSDSIIMRSGEDYRLLMSRLRFLSAWSKAGSWALTVPPIGKLPAKVNVERFLRSVIALESVGQWQAAQQNYLTVLGKWPDNTLARFGLANTLRTEGKLTEAADQYSKVLKQDASHKPARNNLADTLLRLGRCDAAMSVLQPVQNKAVSESEIDKAINTTHAEMQESCPETQ